MLTAHGLSLEGLAVCLADPGEISRIYGDRGAFSRARYRREHRDLFTSQYAAAAADAGGRSWTAGGHRHYIRELGRLSRRHLLSRPARVPQAGDRLIGSDG